MPVELKTRTRQPAARAGAEVEEGWHAGGGGERRRAQGCGSIVGRISTPLKEACRDAFSSLHCSPPLSFRVMKGAVHGVYMADGSAFWEFDMTLVVQMEEERKEACP